MKPKRLLPLIFAGLASLSTAFAGDMVGGISLLGSAGGGGGGGDVSSPASDCTNSPTLALFSTVAGDQLDCSEIIFNDVPTEDLFTFPNRVLIGTAAGRMTIRPFTGQSLTMETLGAGGLSVEASGGGDVSIQSNGGEVAIDSFTSIWYIDGGNTGAPLEINDNGDTGNFNFKMYPQGHIALPTTPNAAIPAGVALSNESHVFVHTDGTLSVRHEDGSIISLEPSSGGTNACPDPNCFTIQTDDETPGSTINLQTLDTSGTSTLVFPPGNANEPGGVSQGGWMAVAEVVGDTYGSAPNGMYMLRARGTFVQGAGTPSVTSTAGTVKDDEGGSEDCNFVGVSGGIELQCTGYENYTGWARIKFVGGGDI